MLTSRLYIVILQFGSLGNSNSTQQISSDTIIKGNGYVRVEHSNGHFTVYGDNGSIDHRTK